jgi:segregation and condensation protein B
MDPDRIRRIVEAALLASDGPLTVANLVQLFADGELDEEDGSKQIREALKTLEEEAEHRGVELKRVASGYRYQVRQDLSEWVSRLWDEKPPRYTRALLETLALVAYKQPVTRGDIEQVRGVSVSQSIMRTLIERDWIRVVGQKEVPGRPSMYGTTKGFLDYFNLKSLDELPPMAEIRALIEPALVEDEPPPELVLPPIDVETEDSSSAADDYAVEINADEVKAAENNAHQDKSDEVNVHQDKSDEDRADEKSSAGAEVVQLHTSSNQPSN